MFPGWDAICVSVPEQQSSNFNVIVIGSYTVFNFGVKTYYAL